MTNVDLSQEKDYQYYAQVLKNGQITKTELVTVRVIKGLTDVEINAMAAVEEAVATLIKSDDFQTLSLQEKADKTTALLESFGTTAALNASATGDANALLGPINNDSILVDLDNKIVSYEYSTGVLAGIMLEPFSESDAPLTQSVSEVVSADQVELQINQQEEPQSHLQQTMSPVEQREAVDNSAPVTAIESVEDTNNEINTAAAGVGDALFLYAFDNTQNSWRYPHYVNVEKKFDGLGLNTSIDTDVTVQDFKDKLDDGYEIIVFSMHGSTYPTKAKKENPALCTIDSTSKAEDQTYSADLKNKRLVKVNTTEGEVYWILPTFFDFYYDSDDLDNTYILMENCNGIGQKGNIDYSLADSLIGSGAESVTGFHNSVLAVYCRELVFDVMDQLIQGKTTQEALNHAKSKYGDKDTGKPAAYPLLRGDGSFKLVSNDFKNGGFENSSILTGWNRIGDVRVLNKIGSLVPTEGKQMAFISTGIGSKESQYLEGTEGSILSQTFVLPKTAKSITLSYDVLSEEPMEYVGSKYDDQFTAELIGSNGQLLKVLAHESVNSSTWFPLAGINFDGGDNTTFHTGWKTAANIDVSGYAGQTVTLRFRVWDKGDSAYDTAVLIDGISIK